MHVVNPGLPLAADKMPLPFTPRYCEIEEKGRRLLVSFNRPRAYNSMPPAMHAELSKIFRYFDTEPSLWVAIVTGKGKAFSAGFDLKAASGLAPAGDLEIDTTSGVNLAIPGPGGGGNNTHDSQAIPGGTGFAGLTERSGIKPVIAAVNGIAHGGGFETALACDVIVASESADFSLPEPKVGLYAAAGGVVRLPRIIGYHNAMRMILTGRGVSAAEAKALGICQLVVAGGCAEVVAAAEGIADEILACSPDAIQASMQVVKRGMAEELSIVRAISKSTEYPAVVRQDASMNRVEGPLAFSKKRRPRWIAPEPLDPSELLQSKL